MIITIQKYFLFFEHFKNKLNIPIVNYKYLNYDYYKIINKLKIKNSDIKNFNNIKDKRNFKDFNKKKLTILYYTTSDTIWRNYGYY